MIAPEMSNKSTTKRLAIRCQHTTSHGKPYFLKFLYLQKTAPYSWDRCAVQNINTAAKIRDRRR